VSGGLGLNLQTGSAKPGSFAAAAPHRTSRSRGGRAPRGEHYSLAIGKALPDTHCTKKLVPSDEWLDGAASVAFVLALTIVMATTLAAASGSL